MTDTISQEETTDTATVQYLIWSNEHQAWWRADRMGYSVYLESAGRYSKQDAIKICAHARSGFRDCDPPSEVPVSEDDALQCLSIRRAALSSEVQS